MVLVNVKGIGEGFPASRKGLGVKKSKGGEAMMEKTAQTQKENQYLRVAEKIIRGESLSESEARLLTDMKSMKEIWFYLNQIMFWGI